jgi:hypothetical protein
MPGRPGAQGRRRCIRAAAAGALLCAAALAGPAWTATILGASNRAVTMATAPVELPLAPADGGPMADALAASRRLRLVIRGLRADQPTGATYNVFIGLARHARPTGAADPHYVGTLSLFDIAGRRDPGGRAVSLDVSDALRQRLARAAPSGPPSSPSAATARPSGSAARAWWRTRRGRRPADADFSIKLLTQP